MSRRWKGPVPERENKQYESGSEEHEARKERQRANANDRVRRRRIRNQRWLINYLHKQSCLDCGLKDVRLLTFDHIDPKEKHANVADLVSRGSKLEHLEAEVEKCEIVCHNCHMLRTFKSLGGSFRERMTPITDQEFEDLRKELGC